MTKNSHIANVAVAGNHSVLGHSNQSPIGVPSQNNSLGVTKRHGEANSSNKWLPQVGNEKSTKNRNGGQNNTTTIQIGKGEIQITNQANSPGPSSIKMYQNQQQQLRVTNQVGQTNPNNFNMEQNRASIQLNQTSRHAKMLQMNNSSKKAGSKRGLSSEIHYKL